MITIFAWIAKKEQTRWEISRYCYPRPKKTAQRNKTCKFRENTAPTVLPEPMPAKITSQDGRFFLLRAEADQETEMQLEAEAKGYGACSRASRGPSPVAPPLPQFPTSPRCPGGAPNGALGRGGVVAASPSAATSRSRIEWPVEEQAQGQRELARRERGAASPLFSPLAAGR